MTAPLRRRQEPRCATIVLALAYQLGRLVDEAIGAARAADAAIVTSRKAIARWTASPSRAP